MKVRGHYIRSKGTDAIYIAIQEGTYIEDISDFSM